MDQTNSKKKKSPWPYAIVGFFIFVISVNLTIAALASRSKDDLVETQPYEAGIAYESTVQAVRATKELGIKARFEVSTAEDGNKKLMAYLLTNNGAVSATNVRATFLRPDDSSSDMRVTFQENLQIPGSYSAGNVNLASGLWLVELDFKLDTDLKIKEKVFID